MQFLSASPNGLEAWREEQASYFSSRNSQSLAQVVGTVVPDKSCWLTTNLTLDQQYRWPILPLQHLPTDPTPTWGSILSSSSPDMHHASLGSSSDPPTAKNHLGEATDTVSWWPLRGWGSGQARSWLSPSWASLDFEVGSPPSLTALLQAPPGNESHTRCPLPSDHLSLSLPPPPRTLGF